LNPQLAIWAGWCFSAVLLTYIGSALPAMLKHLKKDLVLDVMPADTPVSITYGKHTLHIAPLHYMTAEP
jgi:hypothetical protein